MTISERLYQLLNDNEIIIGVSSEANKILLAVNELETCKNKNIEIIKTVELFLQAVSDGVIFLFEHENDMLEENEKTQDYIQMLETLITIKP